MTDFLETYTALLKTLSETYGSQFPVLKEYALSIKELGTLSEDWWRDMGPLDKEIRNQDPCIFQEPCQIPSLILLYIPQLWTNALFSVNSKKYIWDKISKLRI